MDSIKEIKRHLPNVFIDALNERYSPLQIDNILVGMSKERNATLRVNTLKYDIQSLMRYFKENNIKFERVRMV